MKTLHSLKTKLQQTRFWVYTFCTADTCRYFVENVSKGLIVQVFIRGYLLANEWSQCHTIRKHINGSLPSDITCYKSAFVRIHMQSVTGNSPLPCSEETEILITHISAPLWTASPCKQLLWHSMILSSSGQNVLLIQLESVSRMTSSTVNLCQQHLAEPLRPHGITRLMPAVWELPSKLGTASISEENGICVLSLGETAPNILFVVQRCHDNMWILTWAKSHKFFNVSKLVKAKWWTWLISR